MTDWIRIDKNGDDVVGVYVQTASNWVGRSHSHTDKVQWVMPMKSGYGLADAQPAESTSELIRMIPSKTVIMIPPGAKHCHVTKDSPKVILVSLARQNWDILLESWQLDGGEIPQLQYPNQVASTEIKDIMGKMLGAAEQSGLPGSSMLLRSLCTQLALSWLQKTASSAPKFRHEEAIYNLCDKLALDLSHEWTIESMAKAVSLSPSQFVRCFREVVQATPYKYLQQLRLDFAIKQLSQTSRSIDMISEESGFGSRRGLEVALRGQYGMSPNDFRRHPASLDR